MRKAKPVKAWAVVDDIGIGEDATCRCCIWATKAEAESYRRENMGGWFVAGKWRVVRVRIEVEHA